MVEVELRPVVAEPLIGPTGVALEAADKEVLVTGMTVKEMGMVAVTVDGLAVRGQSVTVAGHFEMVISIVE